MGDVDELNSAVGLLIALGGNMCAGATTLDEIQQDLLDLGGELSIPGYTLLGEARVSALDAALAELNASLPRLAEFVRPGGSVAAAQAHMCRTTCRRAERSLIVLSEQQAISPASRQYLNRLSDLLFVLARTLNKTSNVAEPLWDRQTRP